MERVVSVNLNGRAYQLEERAQAHGVALRAWNTRLGHDVLSRIQIGSDEGGLAELQRLLNEELARLIRETARKAHASTDHIVEIVLSGNTTMLHLFAEVDPSAVVAAFSESRATAVAAPAKIAEATWGYADFGPAGAIAARREIADLGIVQVDFANGVTLNLKKTDFQAASISLVDPVILLGWMPEPAPPGPPTVAGRIPSCSC